MGPPSNEGPELAGYSARLISGRTLGSTPRGPKECTKSSGVCYPIRMAKATPRLQRRSENHSYWGHFSFEVGGVGTEWEKGSNLLPGAPGNVLAQFDYDILEVGDLAYTNSGDRTERGIWYCDEKSANGLVVWRRVVDTDTDSDFWTIRDAHTITVAHEPRLAASVISSPANDLLLNLEYAQQATIAADIIDNGDGAGIETALSIGEVVGAFYVRSGVTADPHPLAPPPYAPVDNSIADGYNTAFTGVDIRLRAGNWGSSASLNKIFRVPPFCVLSGAGIGVTKLTFVGQGFYAEAGASIRDLSVFSDAGTPPSTVSPPKFGVAPEGTGAIETYTGHPSVFDTLVIRFIRRPGSLAPRAVTRGLSVVGTNVSLYGSYAIRNVLVASDTRFHETRDNDLTGISYGGGRSGADISGCSFSGLSTGIFIGGSGFFVQGVRVSNCNGSAMLRRFAVVRPDRPILWQGQAGYQYSNVFGLFFSNCTCEFTPTWWSGGFPPNNNPPATLHSVYNPPPPRAPSPPTPWVAGSFGPGDTHPYIPTTGEQYFLELNATRKWFGDTWNCGAGSPQPTEGAGPYGWYSISGVGVTNCHVTWGSSFAAPAERGFLKAVAGWDDGLPVTDPNKRYPAYRANYIRSVSLIGCSATGATIGVKLVSNHCYSSAQQPLVDPQGSGYPPGSGATFVASYNARANDEPIRGVSIGCDFLGEDAFPIFTNVVKVSPYDQQLPTDPAPGSLDSIYWLDTDGKGYL